MQHNTHPQPPTPRTIWALRWLTYGEICIQVIVGILLFLTALVALVYAVYHFIAQLTTTTATVGIPEQTIHLTASQNIAEAIISLLGDLLLVLIIVEVFSTVLHYLRDRAIFLKPFLYIGIISAARDILAISARVAIIGAHGEEFTELMIELGINLGIILGLCLALRLLRKEDATDLL